MSFLCARPGKCLAGRWFVLAILVCLLASSAGCGGFFQSENAIASVTIKPRSVIAGMDESISFTAMARTNGGDEFDVTDSATWTSSSGAARIDGPGRVTTTAQGSVTVTATKDTVKGESSVLVAEYRLQSIDVTPVGPVHFRERRRSAIQSQRSICGRQHPRHHEHCHLVFQRFQCRHRDV